MRNVLTILVAAFLTGTSMDSQDRPHFAIIVNKSNQIHDLSAGKVKLIFLRKISRWPWGAEMLPVDLLDSNPLRQAFVKSMMESSFADLAVYWIDQKVTRGLYPPLRAANPQEAKALVAARLGGIAYIPASDMDDSVRVLDVR